MFLIYDLSLMRFFPSKSIFSGSRPKCIYYDYYGKSIFVQRSLQGTSTIFNRYVQEFFLNQHGSEAGTADYGGALVRTNEQYATSSISCFGRRYNLYQFANSSQMFWLIEIPSSLILILTILY